MNLVNASSKEFKNNNKKKKNQMILLIVLYQLRIHIFFYFIDSICGLEIILCLKELLMV